MASAANAYAPTASDSDAVCGLAFGGDTPSNIAVDPAATDASEHGVSRNSTPITLPRTPADEVERESTAVVKKQKRVRTGCLTCRERHLKCDEAQGQCQNCRKSGRTCIRGIRLNFIDTQVAAPPTYIPPPPASAVTFRDDSRLIASEYVGGIKRYPPPEPEPPPGNHGGQISTTANPNSTDWRTPIPPFKSGKDGVNRGLYFNDPVGMTLMQVFVEKVAPWMDLMDEEKHFTCILPFHALEQPMLYTAFAACAGYHISLVDPSRAANEGSYFYNAAVQMLFDSLEDEHRDSALCATAAVVLSVYELMACGPMANEKHAQTSPARALIRECQWNPQTSGLGGSCFWLNIILELLDCLYFRRKLTWEPDTWGMDMSFDQDQPSTAGNEELWTQRMIYICAKASDFRSSFESQEMGESFSITEINQRTEEWNKYNEWCDRWATLIPRSMMPLGQIQPWQSNSQSVFPQIWLLKRPASLAQLFYHFTRIMLIQTNPLQPRSIPQIQREQQHHAYNICGIVSNERNHGIPIFSVQILTAAAEYLTQEREPQEEVLGILDKITHETGLKTEHAKHKLQETWGWTSYHHPHVPTTVDGGTLLNDSHTHNPDHTYIQMDTSHEVADSVMAFLDQHLIFDHEP